MSLEATRELAGLLGVDVPSLLRANRDRAWTVDGGALAFAALRPGDVIRHPLGGPDVEIHAMGSARLGAGLTSPLTSGEYMTQLQSSFNATTSDAKAQLSQLTGTDLNDSRIAQGTDSATTLLQNGYDPSSSTDNANLIHVISAGLCLVPGVGPLLGGAVETLWLVGNAIACPMQNAMSSIGLGAPCGAPPCATSGNWTAASVLEENKGALPAMPTGSLASIAVAALAAYSAQVGDCKGGPPASAIVDAVIAIWNKTHDGPSEAFYVPALIVEPGTGAPAPGLLLCGAGESVSGSTPAGRAGLDGNIFYAFGPASAAAPYASADLTKPPPEGIPWWPGPPFAESAPVGMTSVAARVVDVNTGSLIAKKYIPFSYLAPSSTTAATTGLTTGEKVAVGAGALAVAGAGAWWALGKPLTLQALKSAVDHFVRRL